jgi:hypothetical protein
LKGGSRFDDSTVCPIYHPTSFLNPRPIVFCDHNARISTSLRLVPLPPGARFRSAPAVISPSQRQDVLPPRPLYSFRLLPLVSNYLAIASPLVSSFDFPPSVSTQHLHSFPSFPFPTSFNTSPFFPSIIFLRTRSISA